MLVALRDALRRREIWVVGASRWRNREDDLSADFEDNRDVHSAAIVKKHGGPWIRVSPHGKRDEPEPLVAVKGEIERRWGTMSSNLVTEWHQRHHGPDVMIH